MISFPNCKINIGLYVINKRTDGFHNIETVFYPINVNDALDIVKSPDGYFSFQTSGLKMGKDIENNLVVKTYRLLEKELNIPPVHIYLLKKIPHSAGLGGGSSDAAFTLMKLNELFELNLSTEQLQLYASKLGSDCPFFILNKPVIATHKGDAFNDVTLSLKDYRISIVKPNQHVKTVEAYQMIKPHNKSPMLDKLVTQPIALWRKSIFNDFEEVIFNQFPEIGKVKDTFYNNGAVYAAMSGSGSAVYGIFKDTIPHMTFPDNYFVFNGKIE